MDMDQFKISKVQIAAFLAIGAGLYLLTSSLLMSLGIMVVLIVAVNTIAHFVCLWKDKRDSEED